LEKRWGKTGRKKGKKTLRDARHSYVWETARKTLRKHNKNNEILRKTETDLWVQPVRALPAGSSN
jgi:hypothetical protein